MEGSPKPFDTIRAAQAGFFTNAAIWLVIGGLSLARMVGKPDLTVTWVVILILMLGNVGAMVFCGVGIGKRQRLYYYLALFVLGANILLSVTDEFGVIDLSTMLIDLLIVGLLLAGRKKFA